MKNVKVSSAHKSGTYSIKFCIKGDDTIQMIVSFDKKI